MNKFSQISSNELEVLKQSLSLAPDILHQYGDVGEIIRHKLFNEIKAELQVRKLEELISDK